MATRLIERFSEIDDSYVTERLYAVAYGVAMRSYDPVSSGELALQVYKTVFASAAPPAHILLREYARGVVERALWLGADIQVDEELARPPYKSSWPKIPDEKTINEIKEKHYDEAWHIFNSVMDNGDFSRYVIGTNSGSTDWLSLTLDDEPWKSSEEITQDFLSNLDLSARAVWDKYKNTKSKYDLYKLLLANKSSNPKYKNAEFFLIENECTEALEQLKLKLTPELRLKLEIVLEAGERGPNPPIFNLTKIQRYVLWRVFELGWTADRFGKFDESIRPRGRDANKPERIGKKYQWLAYHEILAYISDHYQYRERFNESVPAKYEGLWQTYERDIDPSCTTRSTPGGTSWDGHHPSWWAREPYIELNDAVRHEDWVARRNDIPDLKNLLIVSDPEIDCYWINLDGYFLWKQPTPAGFDSDDVDRRALSLNCNGYFIRTSDVEKFMGWANRTQFWRDHDLNMSETGLHKMFLGELGWSPAYHDLFNEYQIYDSNASRDQFPVPVLPASFTYTSSTGNFDCSVDDSFNLNLPFNGPINFLDLKWAGVGADFIDPDGRRAAFDPTAHENGPSSFLFREDLLQKYLRNERFALIWTITGSKRVYYKRGSSKPLEEYMISGAYRYTGQGLEGSLNFGRR